MQDRVTICGGVLGGHPRLVADAILALSVANCRSTWRWRDGSSAQIEPHRKAPWESKINSTCSAAEAAYVERCDDQPAPDPACCFDSPVDPAPAEQ